MNNLLTQIIAKQEAEDLNDSQFAKKLGLKRRLWGRTKTGDIPIGITILKAITRTYYDLDLDIIHFLREDSTGVNKGKS